MTGTIHRVLMMYAVNWGQGDPKEGLISIFSRLIIVLRGLRTWVWAPLWLVSTYDFTTAFEP